MEVVLLEFSRVAVPVRVRQHPALALALLPKTFEPVSVLVGHGPPALVESALEGALVAVAVEDFSPLPMLHVVFPFTFIHGAVLLEVHRAFRLGLLSRASEVALLEARHLQVVEQTRKHTVSNFILLKQLLFFFVLHLSGPEEGTL